MATFNLCFGQKKRRVNFQVGQLLSSGDSIRRIAKILNIHTVTVLRKKRFLSIQASSVNKRFLSQFENRPIKQVQMDEMETFEHTKCKPLSVALVVSDEPGVKRVILGFEISVMPAKGLLAQKAREKYGFRPDLRSKGLTRVLENTKPYIDPTCVITTDQNPNYPGIIRKNLTGSNHIAVKGKRGCIVGQGELKKIGFDPLFSLNHTCAMFRDNVNRLRRKTWCTTKKIEGLREHLNIYMAYHNTQLLKLS